MRKQITANDKRFIKKAKNRLDKGWTWQEIADDLGIPLSTCYSKYERLQGRMVRMQLNQQEVTL